MRRENRVWITGVGLATSLGTSFDALADSVLAGQSGVGPVTRFDAGKHPCQIAACLEPVQCPSGWDSAEFEHHDEFMKLFLWCAVNALRDAGLWEHRNSIRVGMTIGIGAIWFPTWEASWGPRGQLDDQLERDRHSFTQRSSRLLGLRGPSVSVAAACASGNVALSVARDWVRQGVVDVCLAGGVDRSVTPMGMAGFGNLGALSRRNDSPATASRPFDKNRDGFVMGEGGAMFVLESAESARKRGARNYAEMAGYGGTSDAFHMVSPGEDPAHAARAVGIALADAGISPTEIGYINAHGTGTPAGDVFESRVLRTVLGENTMSIPVSATKSMTAHLVGAASAIEAAICLIALDRNAIPPTINLHEVDPECQLNHVALQAQERPVDVAVSNSFGFGGSNTCLVLRRAA